MIANIFAILGVIFGFFVYFWPVPAASAAICRWLKPMIKWIANCNSILHTSEGVFYLNGALNHSIEGKTEHLN